LLSTVNASLTPSAPFSFLPFLLQFARTKSHKSRDSDCVSVCDSCAHVWVNVGPRREIPYSTFFMRPTQQQQQHQQLQQQLSTHSQRAPSSAATTATAIATATSTVTAATTIADATAPTSRCLVFSFLCASLFNFTFLLLSRNIFKNSQANQKPNRNQPTALTKKSTTK